AGDLAAYEIYASPIFMAELGQEVEADRLDAFMRFVRYLPLPHKGAIMEALELSRRVLRGDAKPAEALSLEKELEMFPPRMARRA
ncbi:MAG: hypothetical protein ACP5UU_06045, partial [Thermoprotei archaeon]